MRTCGRHTWWVGLVGVWSVVGAATPDADRPCTPKSDYPSFMTMPPAAPIGELPVADPTGVGTRWNALIQIALRPDPKDFSWYREYGTWVCRFQGQEQVRWYSFPKEANASHIVGALVNGKLMVAPIIDLIRKGMAPEDVVMFTTSQLAHLEQTHPVDRLPAMESTSIEKSGA